MVDCVAGRLHGGLANRAGESRVAQRFYFDLTDGNTIIRDEEGVEVDDAQGALEQAEAAVQEMRADGELVGLKGSWKLLVRTSTDTVLSIISI